MIGPPDWEDVLNELADRLRKASERLLDMATDQGTSPMGMARAMHLESKAEGVQLALSYIEEMLR